MKPVEIVAVAVAIAFLVPISYVTAMFLIAVGVDYLEGRL